MTGAERKPPVARRGEKGRVRRVAGRFEHQELALRAGRCELAFGVMGAHYEPMGHVQIVTNVVGYGMDVQAAIDALVAQTRAIEAVVADLGLTIKVEGSDSLDNPSAVQ